MTFMLLYARGPHAWIPNTTRSPNFTRHQNNIYSDDKAFYFLTVDNGMLERRIQNMPPDITSPAALSLNVSTFNDYLVHLKRSEVNLFSNGQQWFGQRP